MLVLCLVLKIALDHRTGVHLKELLRRRFGSARRSGGTRCLAGAGPSKFSGLLARVRHVSAALPATPWLPGINASYRGHEQRRKAQ